ncbi:acetate/propionate family kinase [Terracidiphilus gabretensis]|uniref:acetate/propionate family kinase n=1 Tax=Terracidiphilus gabretensis TaxID=1577687 RepID=UPI00071B016B|nr:acetate/propionate family kinase [Terracidiphilus gabretensis]
MNVLTLNPGGNSLKADFIACHNAQRYAFEGKSRLSVSIEDIGKSPQLSIMQDKKKAATETIPAESYSQAMSSLLKWWKNQSRNNDFPQMSDVDVIAVRVVHGAHEFTKPALINSHVKARIVEFEKLAPLHNKSSIEILEPAEHQFSRVPMFAVFDTAFHRTMPDYASLYGIPTELAEKHQIRRYGFHGISHRYLLERYAFLAGKKPEQCNIVSTHLESGCSVTAIERGKSVDNTMGVTPLEGLMMGTRSGDIDPSVVALLMHEEHMTVDDVMTLLNKESGLKAMSGISLDTRVLMKVYDSNPKAKLAMDVFAYRVRKAVGAYIAALGTVDAVIFGGGIGENSQFVRKYVCEGLRGFGLEMDSDANERLIDIEGKLSTSKSRLDAWVIPTEEGLQMAHETHCAYRERQQ